MNAHDPQNIDSARLVPEPHARQRRDLLALYAWTLDSSIRLPGGFRIGLDGLLGLIPVVGDVLAAMLSGGIVVHAFRTGASFPIILRMLGNIGLELVVGAIPLIGDLFDFVYRANERNVRLLQQEVAHPIKTRRRSMAWVALVAAGLLAVLWCVAIGLWYLLDILITSVSTL